MVKQTNTSLHIIVSLILLVLVLNIQGCIGENIEETKLPGYELSINKTGDGYLYPYEGVGIYTEGSQVTLIATPQPGWKFDHWEGDISGENNQTIVTVNSNKIITAVFTTVSSRMFRFNTSIVGKGEISPNLSGQYNEGTQIKITAEPSPGWEFDHWEILERKDWDHYFEGAYGTDPTIIITADSNKVIVAVFSYETVLGEVVSEGNVPLILEWEKVIHTETIMERTFCVQQTIDGGFIVLGHSPSKIILLKTDSNGNKMWNKIFTTMDTNSRNSVLQTKDGGFIITGGTRSEIGKQNILLIKTDSGGNQLWTKTINSAEYCQAEGILHTDDDGYVICGNIFESGNGEDQCFLLKTDSNGNEIWQRTYEYTYQSKGNNTAVASFKQTEDGGYVLVGRTRWVDRSEGENERGSWEKWLLKTDSDGNELWNKNLGGYQGSDVCLTNDGGYLVVSLDSLVKVDSGGNQIWTKFACDHPYPCHGFSVTQAEDNGYYYVGSILISEDDRGYVKRWDGYLAKTDTNGNVLWSMKFGEEGWDTFRACQLTDENGVILAGYTDALDDTFVSDIWLVKLKRTQ